MKQIFHPIVRAVILQDGRVLVAQAKGADNTFLPGGHIEIGENTKDALRRELKEELGKSILIHKYLGAMESEWTDSNYHHEISHTFLCSFPDNEKSARPVSLEDHLDFFWIKPEEMASLNLLPKYYRELIPKAMNGEIEAVWNSSLAEKGGE